MFLFPLVQLSLSVLIILLYVQTVWEIFPSPLLSETGHQ